MHHKHHSVNLSLKPKLPEIPKNRNSTGLTRASPELSVYGLTNDTPLKDNHKGYNFFQQKTCSASKKSALKVLDNSSPSPLPLWEIHERIDTFCLVKSDQNLNPYSSIDKIQAEAYCWEKTVSEVMKTISSCTTEIAEVISLFQAQYKRIWNIAFEACKVQIDAATQRNVILQRKIRELTSEIGILTQAAEESQRLQGITQEQISRELKEIFGEEEFELSHLKEKVLLHKATSKIPAADILKELLDRKYTDLAISDYKPQLLPALDMQDYQNLLNDRFKSIQSGTIKRILKHFDSKDKLVDKFSQTIENFVDPILNNETTKNLEKALKKIEKIEKENSGLRSSSRKIEDKYNAVVEERSKLAMDNILKTTEIASLIEKERAMKRKIMVLQGEHEEVPTSPYIKVYNKGDDSKPMSPYVKPMSPYGKTREYLIEEKQKDKSGENPEEIQIKLINIEEKNVFDEVKSPVNSPYVKNRRKSSIFSCNSSREEEESVGESSKDSEGNNRFGSRNSIFLEKNEGVIGEITENESFVIPYPKNEISSPLLFENTKDKKRENTEKIEKIEKIVKIEIIEKEEKIKEIKEIKSNNAKNINVEKTGGASKIVQQKAENINKKSASPTKIPENEIKVPAQVTKTSQIIRKIPEAEPFPKPLPKPSTQNAENLSKKLVQTVPKTNSLQIKISKNDPPKLTASHECNTSQDFSKSPQLLSNQLKSPGKLPESPKKLSKTPIPPSSKPISSSIIRKKPAKIITQNLSILQKPTPMPVSSANSSSSLTNSPQNIQISSIKRKTQKNPSDIDSISPIVKKNASTSTDSTLPNFESHDFSSQFGPEVPITNKEKVYLMPFNPNSVYGLKGDRYFNANNSIFSAQPAIPDLSSSYIFIPPFRTSS